MSAKKQKYYAVKNGRKPGIYTDWDSCKEQVFHFPNAVYKSFTTRKEAEDYLGNVNGTGHQELKKNDSERINEQIENQIATLKPGEAIAFCDGSYDNSLKRTGFGVVLFLPGKKEEFSESFSEEYLVQSRNFSGEMLGAMKAAESALKANAHILTLYYDYQGIEAFADGSWTPKNETAKQYADFMKEIRKKLEVRFVKVPAHQAITWNERADQLAKQSLKIK